ncbi:hypothetical protein BJ508DRAFT_332597 [Ascobolus immersus RN42]|uniref:CCHC-type domain-containing protein n=1 Tax=Ascobolus immersus RN42 TaxID=1160509 RepID=A0A3N4HR24_ASCIM|nr:hypothetical protein BJ508DRAFT_332597 [Ascobolus immersus RN42]
MVLSNKLERLELKGADIARINDTYKATLELLGITDLSKVDESNQYYQMYLRKIRDPNIISTLTLSSLSNGGLTLEDLLKYTARLMVIKATSSNSKPSTPGQSKDSTTSSNRSQNRNNRGPTKKPHKASIHNIEEGSEEEADEVVAAVTSKNPAPNTNSRNPTNTTYNPRRCFFCNDPGHLQSDCDAKKALLAQLKAGKV